MPPARRSSARTASRLIIGLLAGTAMTGCGSADGSAGAAPDSTTVPTPTVTSVKPTRHPMEQCTDQLAYWAEQMIADFDNPGWDYQHMGLTATKYDVLRDIVKGAREAGDALGPTWVQDQIDEACTRILAATPTQTDEVGWP